MAKTFIDDEELNKLACKVIDVQKLDYLNNVSIKYVLVQPEISRTVHSKVIKASSELKHFGNFDFLVEISDSIWSSIDNETRSIILYHLLLHVLVTEDAKGKRSLSVAPHNIQDFSAVITKFGVKWIEEFKNIVVSTYELSPIEKDRIQI